MVFDEETLAHVVQGFPVLYDKAHKEYHRKDVKANAWKAVAAKMELESGKCLYKND